MQQWDDLEEIDLLGEEEAGEGEEENRIESLSLILNEHIKLMKS